MGVFRNAIEATGFDFHYEDIKYLADDIGSVARKIGKQIGELRKMSEAMKVKIDSMAELAKQKAKLAPKTESHKSNGIDTQSRIAKVYKEWVGEDIPDWVSTLSDDDAATYADLLEKASEWDDTQDGENTALHELDAFEDKHSTKAAEAKDASRKESIAKRETGEAKVAESNKDIIAATKRLGVDAYKPVAELKRILNQTKAHADGNPRLEQRVKDIEAVLADREAKKNQAPREGGRYVGDEMPKEEKFYIVAKLVAEALEG